MRGIYLLFTCFLFCYCTEHSEKLFTSIPSSTSGIHFANTITIGDSLTLTGFEYIYNGGGVAVGDINNDGLQDIYFTGNMVSSRLYLNKGGFKFEDITTKSHTGTSTWANGVAMVDINQDGYKDIYVTVGGTRYTPEKERANLLFINNGDATFTESASQYGLADTGYGIQSTFLDFDRDGDLDMYLLRNAFVSYSRNTAKPKAIHGEAPSNDKLFRNNGNGTFSDVTREAGILVEGFGLGVTVGDINEDGWPDIYVSNDFITNDLMWINNRNGTFTNEAGRYLKHQTFNGMGNDVADYNNDGHEDIVVLDMLPEDNRRWKLTPRGNTYDEFQNGLTVGYEPQYVRNTLQLNNGNGTFSEIGQMAGVEATEWSWSALFGDYDNDGLKDLFITNGYGKDITNLDFIVYSDQVETMGLPKVREDERQAMLNELPGIKIHDYMYKNNGDLTFTDVTEPWGVSAPNYSNGAAYADIDNDGDLDLIINNLDDEATLLENKSVRAGQAAGKNYLRISLAGAQGDREGFGTKVIIRAHGSKQFQYLTPVRGYLSSVEQFLHFGLDDLKKIDSVEVFWPDGKYQLLKDVKANQVLHVQYASAIEPAPNSLATNKTILEDVSHQRGIEFEHHENTFVDFKVQPILPHMHSRNGPGIAVADIDGDGLEDCYIGGASGQSGALLKQLSSGRFQSLPIAEIDTLADQLGVLFFDVDNDKDQDLYIVSGGSESGKDSKIYQDHLYLNNGRGKFTPAVEALPEMLESGSCVVAGDYDHDGDLDLFVGGRVVPGEYPKPPKSYLLINNGGKFAIADKDIDGGITSIGMVCAAIWTDYDNDGWIDLVVTGEFMPIRFFHNTGGKLQDETDETGLENTSGWWNSLVGLDADGDGDTDYVAGNLGLNSHFHARANEPLCIYASDFNKDGRLDPVMSQYVQGVKYLAHTRSDLIDQINTMRGRFRTYTSYADATFDQSLTEEEVDASYVVCADRFESSYLENLGKGKFKISSLPLEAQMSPVYGMIAEDFNGDGYPDLLMVGNSYSPEVISGRDDASIGWYLQGQGDGTFTPVSASQSGFFAPGDSKGLAMVIGADGRELVFVGNNSGTVQLYSTKNSARYYRPGTEAAYALVGGTGGKIFKTEFYFGSTYLSQSTRFLKLRPTSKEIEIVDTNGSHHRLSER